MREDIYFGIARTAFLRWPRALTVKCAIGKPETSGDDKWKPDLVYSSIPSTDKGNVTRAREEEPLLLRARKERIKRRPKGLQVFVQLARESRNRSDILLPFSSSSNQRSETATRQFRFKITWLLQYKSCTLYVGFNKIAVILAQISLINTSYTLFIIFTVSK